MRKLDGARFASLGAALVLAACAGMGGHRSGHGWETLIDGANGLENWTPVADANWRAEDGAIVADHKEGKASAFLVSRKSYSDFQLHVEFWASHDANSGIYMRCRDGAAPTDTTCDEANIFDERPDPRYGTGAITHLAAVSPMPKAGGKWNTFDITVKGSRVTVALNGEKTAEIGDSKLSSGPIALQYAAGAIKFRKVALRPL